MIKYDLWEKLKVSENISGCRDIKTVSGISKFEGKISLPVQIFENFPFFMVKSESFKDDVLLGLDAIKELKLCQDENL